MELASSDDVNTTTERDDTSRGLEQGWEEEEGIEEQDGEEADHGISPGTAIYKPKIFHYNRTELVESLTDYFTTWDPTPVNIVEDIHAQSLAILDSSPTILSTYDWNYC